MTDLSLIVLDAPSNLGLRPPEEGSVPGCYKLPWALRDRKLIERLAARDAGCVVPPRYRAEWTPGEGDRNAAAVADYSLALAERLGALVAEQAFVLVLGGECSILLGNTLALKRRGRYGLAYLDAHSDFRHPGNAKAVGAAGGEALAIVTGRGDDRLTNLYGLGPLIRDADVQIVGVRRSDEYLEELGSLGIGVTTSAQVKKGDLQELAEGVIGKLTRQTDGFWIHLDIDVVDSSEMTAVDCPEPDGLQFSQLDELLGLLVASPRCRGMELTIYDPDLDPSGEVADRIVSCLTTALAGPAPRAVS